MIRRSTSPGVEVAHAAAKASPSINTGARFRVGLMQSRALVRGHDSLDGTPDPASRSAGIPADGAGRPTNDE